MKSIHCMQQGENVRADSKLSRQACCGMRPPARAAHALSQASTSVTISSSSALEPSCPRSLLCALCKQQTGALNHTYICQTIQQILCLDSVLHAATMR